MQCSQDSTRHKESGSTAALNCLLQLRLRLRTADCQNLPSRTYALPSSALPLLNGTQQREHFNEKGYLVLPDWWSKQVGNQLLRWWA